MAEDGPWNDFRTPKDDRASAANSDAPWRDFQKQAAPQNGRASVDINPDHIAAARKIGYSDDEIAGFLSKKYPDQFKQATDAGYSSSEILNHFIPARPAPANLAPGQTVTGTTSVNSGVPGLAKAAGAGVVSGAVGLPADVVSLINLARRGYGAVTGNGYDPAKDDYSLGQTYDTVRKAADDLYTPQDSTEALAKTAGSFYPSILTGPESLAGKSSVAAAKILAKRAALQAALPAAASETAGALTQGTDAEPYARAAAAVLAGHLGTRGGAPTPVTAEAASDLAAKNFDDFRSAPVHVKPDVVENAAKDIQNTLASKGLKSAPANSMVDQYIGNSVPVTLNQLQETRSLLGKAASRSDTPEGVAAMHAKEGIDALMDGLTANDIAVGANALPQAMADLKQGRMHTALHKQLEAVERAKYKAKLNVDTSHLSDYDTAQRQQLRSLLINKRVMSKLEPYRQDMEKITKGSIGVNTLRALGTLAGGSGGWHASPYWLAALLAEPVSGSLATAAAVTPFVGAGLRKLQGKAAERQLDALRSKIASGVFPSQQSTISPLLTRALIASQAANGDRQ
jgi:hypothetical protein